MRSRRNNQPSAARYAALQTTMMTTAALAGGAFARSNPDTANSEVMKRIACAFDKAVVMPSSAVRP